MKKNILLILFFNNIVLVSTLAFPFYYFLKPDLQKTIMTLLKGNPYLFSGCIAAVLLVLFTMSFVISMMISRKISSTISSVSSNLDKAASNITSVSNDLSSNTNESTRIITQTASSLQETVASLEQISSMVSQSARAANDLTTLSTKSQDVARTGKTTVEKVLKSIDDIATSNNQIEHEIKNNSEEMKKIVTVISEIGEKTKVINDIVFQTKLLSFNASVEAARAGEHGKGFAVVAEEVGNLASMSGKAAVDITQMLENSINQVENIAQNTQLKIKDMIDTNKAKLTIGTQTAENCDSNLQEILQVSLDLNNLIQEVANASSEQAIGLQEINKAMQELDESSHQNSALVEKVSNLSISLRDQSVDLSQVIGTLTTLFGPSSQMQQDDEQSQIATMNEQTTETKTDFQNVDNVLTLKPKEKVTTSSPSQGLKVAGSDVEIPSEFDDRFEDL